ncbi:MAG: prephenate dehydrogenase/arogenate dehydrogenase family protein [Desulfovibrionales bacterium]|nr:prephenate dehydrogenase/arogenate dehydrogenase family protein [Desulfovibrionales bacterium]
MDKKSITIGLVGGSGRMGQWFKRFFTAAGYSVEIAGRKTAMTPVELAKRSRVFIVTVPIDVTCATIKELGPYLAKDALFMDLTSLKKEPVEAMLKYSKAEVIGTHPLFGPRERSLKGKNIVLCPARGKKWLPWLKDLFGSYGGHLEIMSPDEHDRAMAIVQGLVHAAHMAVGMTVAGSKFPLSTLDSVATPNFKKKLQQVRRLFSQDANLYAQMLFYNPYVLPLLESYMDNLRYLVSAVREKETVAIAKAFAGFRLYIKSGN